MTTKNGPDNLKGPSQAKFLRPPKVGSFTGPSQVRVPPPSGGPLRSPSSLRPRRGFFSKNRDAAHLIYLKKVSLRSLAGLGRFAHSARDYVPTSFAAQIPTTLLFSFVDPRKARSPHSDQGDRRLGNPFATLG